MGIEKSTRLNLAVYNLFSICNNASYPYLITRFDWIDLINLVSIGILNATTYVNNKLIIALFQFLSLQRGSDELLSQAAVMAPASDNNNQDLATKKAKLDSTSTVLGGVGKYTLLKYYNWIWCCSRNPDSFDKGWKNRVNNRIRMRSKAVSTRN